MTAANCLESQSAQLVAIRAERDEVMAKIDAALSPQKEER